MERTKDLVKYILLDEKIEPKVRFLKNDILFHAIMKYKCDYAYANSIFRNMDELGLELCQVFTGATGSEFEYNLRKFARMRGFLSEKEMKHAARRLSEQLEIEREAKEYEKRFIEKYGERSNWTEEIWHKYIHDEEP